MLINKLFGFLISTVANFLIKNKVGDFNKEFEKILNYKKNYEYLLPREFYFFLVIAEDKRYYKHCGFDIYGIFRAVFHNIIFNRLEGASTIEQQLVRTITGKKDIKISRKIKEIFLATQLRKIYSKIEIINFYLDVAYFGKDLIGINSLIDKRYGGDIESLSVRDIAEIIARLKYPEGTNGISKKANIRTSYILFKSKNQFVNKISQSDSGTKIV